MLGPLRSRPQIPSELLDLTEEQYVAQLRDFGFGDAAVEKELRVFREYVAETAPPAKPDPVTDGPTRGKVFDLWIKTRRHHEEREETVEDYEEDEETDEDPWGRLS